MNVTLRTILERYPASVRPTAEPTSLGNAGGLSGSRIWKFPSARGLLAAKLWPGDASERPRIERIHSWIARAGRLGFVPIPAAGRDDRTIQEDAGTLWEISPWMPGNPNPSAAKPAFAALAAFHKAMGEITPNATSPGLASRLGEIESLLARDLDEWREVVARAPADVCKRLAVQWLLHATRIAPLLHPEIREAASKPIAVQPVLRDARPEHFLFTEERVTGLVDFGAMGIDAVSADLARLLEEWLPHDDLASRTEAVAAYERIRPLSDSERDRIIAFERSANLLGGARWIRWHFVEGRNFADQAAIVGRFSRAVERIGRINALIPAWEWPRNPSSNAGRPRH